MKDRYNANTLFTYLHYSSIPTLDRLVEVIKLFCMRHLYFPHSLSKRSSVRSDITKHLEIPIYTEFCFWSQEKRIVFYTIFWRDLTPLISHCSALNYSILNGKWSKCTFPTFGYFFLLTHPTTFSLQFNCVEVEKYHHQTSLRIDFWSQRWFEVLIW